MKKKQIQFSDLVFLQPLGVITSSKTKAFKDTVVEALVQGSIHDNSSSSFKAVGNCNEHDDFVLFKKTSSSDEVTALT